MESYRCSLPLCECDSLRCGLHITIRRVDLRNGVLDLLLTVDVRVDREITNRNLTVCACRDVLRPVIDVSCDFEFQTRNNTIVRCFDDICCTGLQLIAKIHLIRSMRGAVSTYRDVEIGGKLTACAARDLMDCIGAVRQELRRRCAV